MKSEDALVALAALAQEHRLQVFRLLVQAGPDGISAGEMADDLGLAPNNLSFHLDRLKDARLVNVRRKGRMMIYSARYRSMHALIDFLTDKCCTRRG